MSLKVTGEVVSSHYFDLGEVEPTWHTSEFDRSFNARGEFWVHTKNDTELQVEQPDGLNISHFGMTSPILDPEKEKSAPVLSANLADVVGRIDTLYRAHRSITPDKITRHLVDYRVVRLTGRASLLHSLTANILPFSLPGAVHFDNFTSDTEIVSLSHRRVHSTMYIGPTRKFSPRAGFTGTISRFFTPLVVTPPQDHAILSDNNTIHRQSAHIHNPFLPGVFLRTAITVEQPKEEEDIAKAA